MKLSRVEKQRRLSRRKRTVAIKLTSLFALSIFAISEITPSTYALFENTQEVKSNISAAVAFPDTIQKLEKQLNDMYEQMRQTYQQIREAYISACQGNAENANIQMRKVRDLQQEINQLLAQAQPLLKKWQEYNEKAKDVVEQRNKAKDELVKQRDLLNSKQDGLGDQVRIALNTAMTVRNQEPDNPSAIAQAEQNVQESLRTVDLLNEQKAEKADQIKEANVYIQSATAILQYIQQGFTRNRNGLKTAEKNMENFQDQVPEINNTIEKIQQEAIRKEMEENQANLNSGTGPAPTQSPASSPTPGPSGITTGQTKQQIPASPAGSGNEPQPDKQVTSQAASNGNDGGSNARNTSDSGNNTGATSSN